MREHWESLEAGLRGLRAYDPDPEKVERIRARCLFALAMLRQKERAGSRFSAWRVWLEPAVACGLSAIYLAAAFSSSLALLR